MPIQPCKSNNKSGYKYGTKGKCYTYITNNTASRKRAKKKAMQQGLAIAHKTRTKVHL